MKRKNAVIPQWTREKRERRASEGDVVRRDDESTSSDDDHFRRKRFSEYEKRLRREAQRVEALLNYPDEESFVDIAKIGDIFFHSKMIITRTVQNMTDDSHQATCWKRDDGEDPSRCHLEVNFVEKRTKDQEKEMRASCVQYESDVHLIYLSPDLDVNLIPVFTGVTCGMSEFNNLLSCLLSPTIKSRIILSMVEMMILKLSFRVKKERKEDGPGNQKRWLNRARESSTALYERLTLDERRIPERRGLYEKYKYVFDLSQTFMAHLKSSQLKYTRQYVDHWWVNNRTGRYPNELICAVVTEPDCVVNSAGVALLLYVATDRSDLFEDKVTMRCVQTISRSRVEPDDHLLEWLKDSSKTLNFHTSMKKSMLVEAREANEEDDEMLSWFVSNLTNSAYTENEYIDTCDRVLRKLNSKKMMSMSPSGGIKRLGSAASVSHLLKMLCSRYSLDSALSSKLSIMRQCQTLFENFSSEYRITVRSEDAKTGLDIILDQCLMLRSLTEETSDERAFMDNYIALLNSEHDPTADKLWDYTTSFKGFIGELTCCNLYDIPWESEFDKGTLQDKLENVGIMVGNDFIYCPQVLSQSPDGLVYDEENKQLTIYEFGWQFDKVAKEKRDKEKWFDFTHIMSKRNIRVKVEVCILVSWESWDTLFKERGKIMPSFLQSAKDSIRVIFRSLRELSPSAFVMNIEGISLTKFRLNKTHQNIRDPIRDKENHLKKYEEIHKDFMGESPEVDEGEFRNFLFQTGNYEPNANPLFEISKTRLADIALKLRLDTTIVTTGKEAGEILLNAWKDEEMNAGTYVPGSDCTCQIPLMSHNEGDIDKKPSLDVVSICKAALPNQNALSTVTVFEGMSGMKKERVIRMKKLMKTVSWDESDRNEFPYIISKGGKFKIKHDRPLLVKEADEVSVKNELETMLKGANIDINLGLALSETSLKDVSLLLKKVRNKIEPMSELVLDERVNKLIKWNKEKAEKISNKAGAFFQPNLVQEKKLDDMMKRLASKDFNDRPDLIPETFVSSELLGKLSEDKTIYKPAVTLLMKMLSASTRYPGFWYAMLAHKIGISFLNCVLKNKTNGNMFVVDLGILGMQMVCYMSPYCSSDKATGQCVLINNGKRWLCTSGNSNPSEDEVSHVFHMNTRLAKQYEASAAMTLSFNMLLAQEESWLEDENNMNALLANMWSIQNVLSLTTLQNMNVLTSNTRYYMMAFLGTEMDAKGLGKKMFVPIRSTFDHKIRSMIRKDVKKWAGFCETNKKKLRDAMIRAEDKHFKFPCWLTGGQMTNPLSVVLVLSIYHNYNREINPKEHGMIAIFNKSTEMYLKLKEAKKENWRKITGLDACLGEEEFYQHVEKIMREGCDVTSCSGRICHDAGRSLEREIMLKNWKGTPNVNVGLSVITNSTSIIDAPVLRIDPKEAVQLIRKEELSRTTKLLSGPSSTDAETKARVRRVTELTKKEEAFVSAISKHKSDISNRLTVLDMIKADSLSCFRSDPKYLQKTINTVKWYGRHKKSKFSKLPTFEETDEISDVVKAEWVKLGLNEDDIFSKTYTNEVQILFNNVKSVKSDMAEKPNINLDSILKEATELLVEKLESVEFRKDVLKLIVAVAIFTNYDDVTIESLLTYIQEGSVKTETIPKSMKVMTNVMPYIFTECNKVPIVYTVAEALMGADSLGVMKLRNIQPSGSYLEGLFSRFSTTLYDLTGTSVGITLCSSVACYKDTNAQSVLARKIDMKVLSKVRASKRTKVIFALIREFIDKSVSGPDMRTCIQMLVEFYIVRRNNDYYGLAPKEQNAGPRELGIQDLPTRLCNYMMEEVVRAINMKIDSSTLTESLSHPKAKYRHLDDASGRAMDAAGERSVGNNTIVVGDNDDHSKWAPNNATGFNMRHVISGMRETLGVHHDFIMLQLARGCVKEVEIPAMIVKHVLSPGYVKGDKIRDFVHDYVVDTRRISLSKPTDMIQGIPHHTSSLCAMAAHNYIQPIMIDIALRCGVSLIRRVIEGSDDQFSLKTLTMSKDERTYTELPGYDKEDKTDYLLEVSKLLTICEKSLLTLFCMKKSPKSTHSEFAMEFNSCYNMGKRNSPSKYKFCSTQLMMQRCVNMSESQTSLFGALQQGLYMGVPIVNLLLLWLRHNTLILNNASVLRHKLSAETHLIELKPFKGLGLCKKVTVTKTITGKNRVDEDEQLNMPSCLGGVFSPKVSTLLTSSVSREELRRVKQLTTKNEYKWLLGLMKKDMSSVTSALMLLKHTNECAFEMETHRILSGAIMDLKKSIRCMQEKVKLKIGVTSHADIVYNQLATHMRPITSDIDGARLIKVLQSDSMESSLVDMSALSCLKNCFQLYNAKFHGVKEERLTFRDYVKKKKENWSDDDEQEKLLMICDLLDDRRHGKRKLADVIENFEKLENADFLPDKTGVFGHGNLQLVSSHDGFKNPALNLMVIIFFPDKVDESLHFNRTVTSSLTEEVSVIKEVYAPEVSLIQEYIKDNTIEADVSGTVNTLMDSITSRRFRSVDIFYPGIRTEDDTFILQMVLGKNMVAGYETVMSVLDSSILHPRADDIELREVLGCMALCQALTPKSELNACLSRLYTNPMVMARSDRRTLKMLLVEESERIKGQNYNLYKRSLVLRAAFSDPEALSEVQSQTNRSNRNVQHYYSSNMPRVELRDKYRLGVCVKLENTYAFFSSTTDMEFIKSLFNTGVTAFSSQARHAILGQPLEFLQHEEGSKMSRLAFQRYGGKTTKCMYVYAKQGVKVEVSEHSTEFAQNRIYINDDMILTVTQSIPAANSSPLVNLDDKGINVSYVSDKADPIRRIELNRIEKVVNDFAILIYTLDENATLAKLSETMKESVKGAKLTRVVHSSIQWPVKITSRSLEMFTRFIRKVPDIPIIMESSDMTEGLVVLRSDGNKTQWLDERDVATEVCPITETASWKSSLTDTSSSIITTEKTQRDVFKSEVTRLIEVLNKNEEMEDREQIISVLEMILSSGFGSYSDKEATNMWSTLQNLSLGETSIDIDMSSLYINSGNSDDWAIFLSTQGNTSRMTHMLTKEQVKYHLLTKDIDTRISLILSHFHTPPRTLVNAFSSLGWVCSTLGCSLECPEPEAAEGDDPEESEPSEDDMSGVKMFETKNLRDLTPDYVKEVLSDNNPMCFENTLRLIVGLYHVCVRQSSDMRVCDPVRMYDMEVFRMVVEELNYDVAVVYVRVKKLTQSAPKLYQAVKDLDVDNTLSKVARSRTRRGRRYLQGELTVEMDLERFYIFCCTVEDAADSN